MENVTKINYQDKEIYLVKTAHVSKNSVEDVKNAFDEINPDSICIELDEKRYASLNDKESWRNQDITQVIKNGEVGLLLVNIILASFQRRMAKSLNTNTGGEMMAGIELSKQYNKELVLADRSVNTTFKRVWASLTFKEKTNLLSTIIASIFDKEEVSEKELQDLKEENVLDAALNDVAKDFPNVKRTLVDERDQYLAQKIKTAPGKKVMAIIGAAHGKGIEKNLDNDVNIDELNKIEKKKGIGSFIKWFIPLFIIAMLVYTVIMNRETGLEQIKIWVIVNGTSAAIGTLLCAAHPLTILTAFVSAPITSLNPLISCGLFASLVEAKIKKPKVKDFEDLGEDTTTIKGFFKNGVTRILLIFILANLFSSIATFVTGAGILKSLINLLK